LLQEGAVDNEYDVFILEGGFADFQKLFRVSRFVKYQCPLSHNVPFRQHDPELVENLQLNHSEAPPRRLSSEFVQATNS